MNVYIFRCLEVDGVKYYQLAMEIPNFEPDEDYTDFSHRGEKKYFYLDSDSEIKLPDPTPYRVYYDSEDGFVPLPPANELHDKVFQAFLDTFKIIIKTIKPIDEVVDSVDKKIMFQKDVIYNLVHRIYLNQQFIMGNLPIELKQIQKKNILFHGLSGSGKKTIVNCLKKELNLPYADYALGPSANTNLKDITLALLERAETPELASYGVVFIRDNFEQLAESLNGIEPVYELINYLTEQEIVTIKDQNVDFRTVTFVILYDDDKHFEQYNEVKNILSLEEDFTTKLLTYKQKYKILFSDYGVISEYARFLNSYRCNFIYDEKCLMALIRKAAVYGPCMDAVNFMISAIVTECTSGGLTDVVINKENLDLLASVIYNQFDSQKGDKKKEKQEKYLFDKKVDAVFEKAKKYVIGQDDNLRLLISNIITNLEIAERNDLYSPESYKLNILIRGNTGNGKTFMVKNVCKIISEMFGVAFAQGDSTSYTETGYVGGCVDSVLVDLYKAAGYDLEKAQKGIVFLDEIDKKSDNGTERSSITRTAVLHELLKPTEGSVVRLNIGTDKSAEYIFFDTTKVTFIIGGAFTGIEEIRNIRLKKNNLGFGSAIHEQVNTLLDPKLDPNITNEDYINYGMPPEFMGRVKSVVDLENITVNSLLEIMDKGDLNTLKIKKVLFGIRDIEVEFTDDFREEIAKIAVARKQGVRGLDNAVEAILQRIKHQNIRGSEVKKIILNKDAIYDPSKVILVGRGRQKKLKN